MTAQRSPARPAPCPICRKPAAADFRPFCSDRCQKIDLGRWLKGVYAIPTDEPAPGPDGGPGGEPEDER